MTRYRPRHQAPDAGAVVMAEPLTLEDHDEVHVQHDMNEVDDQGVDDPFDPDSWTGAEQLALFLFALAGPLVLVYWVYQHLSEAWADWITLPIWGVGDMVFAGAFVLIDGSLRVAFQRLTGRSTKESRLKPYGNRLRPSPHRGEAGRPHGRPAPPGSDRA